MKYRALGRTGVEVSAIGLGTMNFGGRVDERGCRALLDRAVTAGVNLIDTANVYGHDPGTYCSGRGRSEEIIGRWLADHDRDSLVLASKVFFPMHERVGALGPSRLNIIRETHATLRRLGVDHLDVLQLHHPSNDVPIDETLRALDHLVRAGDVVYVGTSSFAAWQLVESLWISDRHHLTPVSTEQCVYNLLDRRPERELFGVTATYGIGVLTWSPLAGGLLATRHPETIAAGSRYDQFWSTRRSAITAEVARTVDRLHAVADDAAVALAQLAQAWALANPCVASMLIGPRTTDQLDIALASVDLDVAPDLLSAIDTIVTPHRVTMPQYGHDGMTWAPWGPHTQPTR